MTRNQMAKVLEWSIITTHSPAIPVSATDIRTIIDELRRTCEWTEDRTGNWNTTCLRHVLTMWRQPAKFCGYCGGTLVERPYVAPMRLQNDTQEPV